MSVRSFHSVFMASAVAGAALGCYLVSLRVASERAALETVENQIVLAQRDIRLLQTEIGTRARLAQLERWNVRVLSLSAPTADQILGDKFQLASMIAPERRPAVEAPVILATAPAPPPTRPLEAASDGTAATAPGGLLHEAGLKVAQREPAAPKPKRAEPPKPGPKPAIAGAGAAKGPDEAAKPEKKAKAATPPAPPTARPVRTARVDPLAPLPAEASTAEASRTQR